MTDRERFNNQMRYKPVDRCYNMEFGYWEENFKEWPIFVEHGVKNNNEADIFFNFDRRRSVGSPIWMLPAFEQKIVGETETTQILRNADGLLAEVPKSGHSTIPHFVDATIKTPDDWKRAKEERFRLDDPKRQVNVEELKRRYPPGADSPLAVGVGSLIGKIRNMLTMEGLIYACVDYPGMVEDMVETACQLIERSLDLILPHIAVDYAHGWEDICCNNGPLVSMDFIENVLGPRYKRIGEKLRQYGVDIWLTDCDGDVRPMIPTFLAAGLNTMFPFEVKGCGHPGETLDKYGPELRIMGGVDKNVLAAGPEAIKAYLESIAPYVERGGFIPFCDHRCPPNVRQEYYLYYLDLKERMFGMQE